MRLRLSETELFRVERTPGASEINFETSTIKLQMPIDIIHEVLHHSVRRIMNQQPDKILKVTPGTQEVSGMITEERLVRSISDHLEWVLANNIKNEHLRNALITNAPIPISSVLLPLVQSKMAPGWQQNIANMALMQIQQMGGNLDLMQMLFGDANISQGDQFIDPRSYRRNR